MLVELLLGTKAGRVPPPTSPLTHKAFTSPTVPLDAAGAAHEPTPPAARMSSDEVVCHAAQLSRTP